MHQIFFIRDLLLRPKEVWLKISNQSIDLKNLFLTYAMVLAFIPAVAIAIGYGVVGLKVGAVGYFKMSLWSAVFAALAAYAINLLAVYAAGLALRFIGNYFHAEAPLSAYLTLVIYSATPVWLAGIFYLVPALSMLGFLSIYGVYLLYLGLPILIKIPEDKALPYTVWVIVAMIVTVIIANFLISQFIYGPLYSEFLSY